MCFGETIFQRNKNMHYELGYGEDRILAPLQQFSHMKIDTSRDATMPVLYVAMATWIPKCNMYHNKYVLECLLLQLRFFFGERLFIIKTECFLYTYLICCLFCFDLRPTCYNN